MTKWQFFILLTSIVIGSAGFLGIGFYTNFFESQFNFDCPLCLLKTLSPIIFLLVSIYFGFALSGSRKYGIKLLEFFGAIFSVVIIGGIIRNNLENHIDFQGLDGIVKSIMIILIFGIIFYFFNIKI